MLPTKQMWQDIDELEKSNFRSSGPQRAAALPMTMIIIYIFVYLLKIIKCYSKYKYLIELSLIKT